MVALHFYVDCCGPEKFYSIVGRSQDGLCGRMDEAIEVSICTDSVDRHACIGFEVVGRTRTQAMPRGLRMLYKNIVVCVPLVCHF